MPVDRSLGNARPLVLLLLVLVGCSASAKDWRRQRQAAFDGTDSPDPPPPSSTEDERPPPPPPVIVRASPSDRRGIQKNAETMRLDTLAKRVGADPRPIERPCANQRCKVRVLDRLFQRLDELDDGDDRSVRILQLGDSHIAADYITRTIREALQDRFGPGGRGFVPVAQRAEYGGRLKSRQGWNRFRVADPGQRGKPFGFSGLAMRSTRRGARLIFKLAQKDDEAEIYFHAHPKGAPIRVYAGGNELAVIDTQAELPQSRVTRVTVPASARARPRKSFLEIEADRSGALVFGVSFESERPGILYDSVGPVGADADVYLGFEQNSMRAHLQALKPDLIVLMVGGNDGLAVRSGTRSLDEVRQQHIELIRTLKQHVPTAECMIWAPMDAGERLKGDIVSKPYISEIRDLQRDAAIGQGCAYWDTLATMGEEGSFGRWFEEGLMNRDLVHPRAKGGDLMGRLFVRALMDSYVNGN